jgi:putative MATE family efflux protein
MRLAAPNLVALATQSMVVIAETSLIGRIGTEALAAMALVFPTIVFTQMLAAGAMGGGVSSAISRAIGAGDEARARRLAMNALAIGLTAGLVMSMAVMAVRPGLYALLGGRGAVLELAVAYAGAFFSGATTVWLFNTLNSIVRGTGNMRVPSACTIGVALAQISLGAVLSLGLGPSPELGLVGIGLAQVLANAGGALVLLFVLTRRGARLRLGLSAASLDGAMLWDILKVGALACASPVQAILVVVILGRIAAGLGTTALAAFGIGSRLELMLTPIAFAIGVAATPMVGMAVGAGRIERARQVALTGATLAGGLVGLIGVVVSFEPWLWARIYTSEPKVLDAAYRYLAIAGLGFAGYGFGLCLYFASQGSGHILGPVLASTVRLAIVVAGGLWLSREQGSIEALALLVATATLTYAAANGLFFALARWGPAAPAPRPAAAS